MEEQPPAPPSNFEAMQGVGRVPIITVCVSGLRVQQQSRWKLMVEG